MSTDILFLGLNNIGASIGMALANLELEVNRIGYDLDRQLAQRAHRAGAVDDLVSHPESAAENADVVILTTTILDVHDHLKMLGASLKADSVVIDTTPLKVPTMGWASEALPENRHYIGATPIVGPVSYIDKIYDSETPRADLFHGGLMAIVIPKNTPETAVTEAVNLASALGTTPFFLDPHEHDAVIATVEGLPCLIGTAMMQMASHAKNWREIQRMAGSSFATATSSGSMHSPQTQAATLILNHEIILYKIDALLEEVKTLRTFITEKDNDALINYLTESKESRDAMLAARQHGDWASQEIQSAERVEKPGVLRSLFGIKPRRTKNHDKNL